MEFGTELHLKHLAFLAYDFFYGEREFFFGMSHKELTTLKTRKRVLKSKTTAIIVHDRVLTR